MKRGNPTQKASPSEAKNPKQEVNPSASNHETPVWSFHLYNHFGPWEITESDFFNEILPHLQSRETQTWNEILSQAGGKSEGNGTNNHPIPRSRLAPEAQEVLKLRKLDDHTHFFSLRMTGRKRIWGIRDGRILRILWYDKDHSICPSNR